MTVFSGACGWSENCGRFGGSTWYWRIRPDPRARPIERGLSWRLHRTGMATARSLRLAFRPAPRFELNRSPQRDLGETLSDVACTRVVSPIGGTLRAGALPETEIRQGSVMATLLANEAITISHIAYLGHIADTGPGSMHNKIGRRVSSSPRGRSISSSPASASTTSPDSRSAGRSPASTSFTMVRRLTSSPIST